MEGKEQVNILTDEFVVMPGRDGSFVIRRGQHGQYPDVWGFSDVRDMMTFLTKKADELMASKARGKG